MARRSKQDQRPKILTEDVDPIPKWDGLTEAERFRARVEAESYKQRENDSAEEAEVKAYEMNYVYDLKATHEAGAVGRYKEELSVLKQGVSAAYADADAASDADIDEYLKETFSRKRLLILLGFYICLMGSYFFVDPLNGSAAKKFIHFLLGFLFFVGYFSPTYGFIFMMSFIVGLIFPTIHTIMVFFSGKGSDIWE